MEAINGTWLMGTSENEKNGMEEFVKNAGFPAEMQKEFMDRQYKATYKVVDAETVTGHYSIVNRPNKGTKDFVFKLNQEVELEGFDGEKSKCTMTFDGKNLNEKHVGDMGEIVQLREVNGDQMFVTATLKGVSFKQVWKKC